MKKVAKIGEVGILECYNGRMLMLYYNLQMTKASLIINLLISFLTVWSTCQLEPFITEFIIPFDLPINDLKAAASNQLSRNQFKTNTFKTDNITVSKLTFKSIYNGSNRIIDPKEQSTFHSVWNDSIDLVVTYQAEANKLTTQKKTFNGTTRLKVYVNYTKMLIIENDTTQVRAVTVIVDQKSFEMSYTGNPSDSQKKKLDEINNGVVSGKNNITILSLLKTQQFTQQSMQIYFKENLANQKISPTYQSTYNYNFCNNSYVFDMTTAGVDSVQHGIAHYLKGTIKNFQSPQVPKESVAPYEEGYHSLFSVNFMNYFMRYNAQKNPDWLNFKINNNNFRTRVFKFRLVDLQFLFPKLVSKYTQYYLNFISIVCTPTSFGNWAFDTEKTNLKLDMSWHCQGKLDGPSPAALILDFDASLNYLVEVRLYSDMLEVYLANSDLQDLQFQPIDEEVVQDLELAGVYASEVVESLRGYTVGSSFKVKQNSSKLMLKEDIGIYVG